VDGDAAYSVQISAFLLDRLRDQSPLHLVELLLHFVFGFKQTGTVLFLDDGEVILQASANLGQYQSCLTCFMAETYS